LTSESGFATLPDANFSLLAGEFISLAATIPSPDYTNRDISVYGLAEPALPAEASVGG